MTETLEYRVLGAVRWVDAVTGRPAIAPFQVTSATLSFRRNASGLAVVVGAAGLEAYTGCFDLSRLPDDKKVDPLSKPHAAEVRDLSGRYLPRQFTVDLPRRDRPLFDDAGNRPAGSLFEPFDVRLLPTPTAAMAPGWTDVRVTATGPDGKPLKNLFLRVRKASGTPVWGRGMTDDRGDGLVVIPALDPFPLAADGTPVEDGGIPATLEVIPNAPDRELADWTQLDELDATDENTRAIRLRSGRTCAVTYPFEADA